MFCQLCLQFKLHLLLSPHLRIICLVKINLLLIRNCHNHVQIVPYIKLSKWSIQDLYSFAQCNFQVNSKGCVIFLANFGKRKIRLRQTKDLVIFQHFSTAKKWHRFFPKLHPPRISKRCFTWQYEY